MCSNTVSAFKVRRKTCWKWVDGPFKIYIYIQHDLIYDLTNHSRDGMTDTYKKIQEKEQYIKFK